MRPRHSLLHACCALAILLGGSVSAECPEGELIVNHDDSFEYAYCWQFGGCQPPYYGAIGEAFEAGPGTVHCGVIWLTGIGYQLDRPIDVYVWDGGVHTEPGEVLALNPSVTVNDGYWPDCYRNDIELEAEVTGEFTIGYWEDAVDSECLYWCCADEDGPGGISWTCVAPGQPWPTGWQPIPTVWPDVHSMGIGAYFESGPTPVEPGSWGRIKALFQ